MNTTLTPTVTWYAELQEWKRQHGVQSDVIGRFRVLAMIPGPTGLARVSCTRPTEQEACEALALSADLPPPPPRP